MLRLALLISVTLLTTFAHAEPIRGSGTITATPAGAVQLTFGDQLARAIIAAPGAKVTESSERAATIKAGIFECTMTDQVSLFVGANTIAYCVAALVPAIEHAGGDPCCQTREGTTVLAKGFVVGYQDSKSGDFWVAMTQDLSAFVIGLPKGQNSGFKCSHDPSYLNLPVLKQILPEDYLFTDSCGAIIPAPAQ